VPSVLLTNTCDEIQSNPIQWLWKPFIARGKLAMLVGDPGIGKSLFAVDLAARLSRNGPLPDGQKIGRLHNTLLLSAEGDASDTVRPRMIAANAELSRVIVAGTKGSEPLPQLPECAESLAQAIRKHAVDLVVIDPISAFLPKTLTATDQSIRQALAPLAKVAAVTNCAVLLLRHLSRSVGPNAAYRGSGNTGLLGMARTAMLLARHTEESDLRVLAMTKTHLGPPPPSLGFRLKASDSGSSLLWGGAVDLSADELCISRTAQLVSRPRERAVEFLKAALASGPRPVSELEKLASERGVAWRTVERAKGVLGVVTEHVKKGALPGWYWRLLPPRGDEGMDLAHDEIREQREKRTSESPEG
jgi:hypothetical protein